jgi:hypothetical protein
LGSQPPKAVSLHDQPQEVQDAYQCMLDRSAIPDELKPYFEARKIAAMHYERNHDASAAWSAKAYERLADALDLNPGLAFHLDGNFDPHDDDFESLPGAFKRVNKKKFMAQC